MLDASNIAFQDQRTINCLQAAPPADIFSPAARCGFSSGAFPSALAGLAHLHPTARPPPAAKARESIMLEKLSITDAMASAELFEPWFRGESWDGWRAILKAAFALPMTPDEFAFFVQVAGGRAPPKKRVRELWIIAGRRAGKDSIASLIAAYAAALFPHGDRLRPGERAQVMCLACDRDQAAIVKNYTRSYFDLIPALEGLVTGETKDGFSLSNRIDVTVATNSFRSVRGRPVAIAILDELAYYRDENSATPDEELYTALRPALVTLPDSMVIGISSPYRRAGLLYRKFAASFGKDEDDVLVIRAPSRLLNPTIDQREVDAALEEDAAAARSEWLAEWRDDIQAYVSREVIDAAVVPGRRELPRVAGVQYFGFVDPSGGSADEMTLAIAHKESEAVILDCLRAARPPFSPDEVTRQFAAVLRAYGLSKVTGDRYGGEWPRERFASHGISYVPSEKNKSDLYKEALPLLNAGRVELLDEPKLVAQFCALERRTARGGRDSVDHPISGADDRSNCVAGAIVATAMGSDQLAGLQDYLESNGQAVELMRPIALVYATAYVEKAGPNVGKTGVAFFADKRMFDLGLVLCDFQVGVVSDALLRGVIERLAELSDATMTAGFAFFSDATTIRRFEAIAHRFGDPRATWQDVPDVDELAPAAAAGHVASGRVRITSEALQKAQSSPLGAALSFEFGQRSELSVAIMMGIVAGYEN
jgi:hypothetical protein